MAMVRWRRPRGKECPGFLEDKRRAQAERAGPLGAEGLRMEAQGAKPGAARV